MKYGGWVVNFQRLLPIEEFGMWVFFRRIAVAFRSFLWDGKNRAPEKWVLSRHGEFCRWKSDTLERATQELLVETAPSPDCETPLRYLCLSLENYSKLRWKKTKLTKKMGLKRQKTVEQKESNKKKWWWEWNDEMHKKELFWEPVSGISRQDYSAATDSVKTDHKKLLSIVYQLSQIKIWRSDQVITHLSQIWLLHCSNYDWINMFYKIISFPSFFIDSL